ncbi:aminodeoxychorismate/anthranilate synthase component II [Candidatus Bathyarchaeota archaeon]|nr:aminodeoxychorismate/anthranilate synthase component II [Candidatus Bathyarchaeota archaeon]
MKVLVIDNYDSFVYNLVQYFGELGAEVKIYRNNKITLNQIKKINPKRIVISPGPGTPEKKVYFGICSEILQKISRKTPTLGVCLGHQGIIHSFGGKISPAKKLMHGKTSTIRHDGKTIFKGVKNPITGTRYHSLIGDKQFIPDCLEVSATSIEDGEVMAVRHIKYPIEGVQFHPESILCQDGKLIIKNFFEGHY